MYTAIAVGALIVTALTGCSNLAPSDRGVKFTTSPRPTATTPIDPDVALAQSIAKIVKGKANGSLLSATEAKTVGQGGTGSWMAYQGSDGAWTLISPHDPLPGNVKVDVAARVAGAAQQSKDAGDPNVIAPILNV